MMFNPNLFVIMKNIFLLVFMLLPNWVLAQQIKSTDYETWLKEYVTLRSQNKDSAFPLMKIKDYYNLLSDTEKDNVNAKMVDWVSEYLNRNLQDEAMAMIDLYDYLVDRSDAKRPILYFIRGNIYAERQDSVMLKETIAQMERCNGKQEYLDKLNDYLLQIRRLVSVDQVLDGYWVSDNLVESWTNYALPKYILKAKSDKTSSLTITGNSPFLSHC